MREVIENAIDQADLRNIPVSEISVEEECADPPTDPEDTCEFCLEQKGLSPFEERRFGSR